MAIADIVDNSIAAQAIVISIRFSWNNGTPWLAVIDDGRGMAKDELINAMRFGSKNPLEERQIHDLGRFGLGMKTASFSQCRRLIVLSKKNNDFYCCEWDLDSIAKNDDGKWNLRLLDSELVNKHKILSILRDEYLSTLKSGTIVLWEKIDRLEDLGEIGKQESNFNSLVSEARNHLELVFHRFLSPGPGGRKTEIFMNDDLLDAFDPFTTHNVATQELPVQSFQLEGKKITVQPYVLPHHNKTTPEEYKKYGGKGGYLHNQGFYVYRNKRLIIKGTWFRLIKKEELNKLLRVRIDIPNSLDHLWNIDIKKSDASPPEIIRNRLKQVIERIEYSGRKVYQQKGNKLKSKINTPVWNRIASNNAIIYQINRQHPLIKNFLDTIDTEHQEMFRILLSMTENSFPVEQFFNDVANKPEQVEKPIYEAGNIESLLNLFLDSMDNAKEINFSELLLMEPFVHYQEQTKTILRKMELLNE